MHARYRKSVTPAHVGERVTIRYWDTGPPAPGPTDVVGILEAWDEGVLTVRRRDERRVAVDETAVMASRVIPPPAGARPSGRA